MTILLIISSAISIYPILLSTHQCKLFFNDVNSANKISTTNVIHKTIQVIIIFIKKG